MPRIRRKCQLCGRIDAELREIRTPAGKRWWCVLCRTPELFRRLDAARKRPCGNPTCSGH